MAVLDVWVARTGMACRVDDLDWTVHVHDAHDEPYSWAGNSFAALSAPNGHWAGTLPPGTYVVRATRKAKEKGQPTRADAAIVTIGCEGVACVRLYVAGRPARDPKPPRDPREEEERPDKDRPEEEGRPDREQADKDQQEPGRPRRRR